MLSKKRLDGDRGNHITQKEDDRIHDFIKKNDTYLLEGSDFKLWPEDLNDQEVVCQIGYRSNEFRQVKVK